MDDAAAGQVEFSKVIAEHYNRLTKSGRKIAEYIQANQDEAAFMTAAEIAEELRLSEPTLIRFARTLGFDSYPAMRIALQAKARTLAKHSARIRRRLENLHESGDIYEQLATSEIDFITESIHTLDRREFSIAVELLRTHQRIFIFGVGPSVSLVDLLEIRLTRSARHVIPLRTLGRELIEPLVLMNKDDLLIAIAFHSVNQYLQMVLQQAKKNQTPVILITDTLGDLVGKYATATLAARRGPVMAFHSVTVPMTIINALLLALSSVDQENILSNLDKMDQLLNNFPQLNSPSQPK